MASPDQSIAQTQGLDPLIVVEEGLIAREEGSATREAAERHFSSLGITPKIALELGSNQAVKQAAAAGGGVGIISRLGVVAELKAGMLAVLDVAGWSCRRPLTLIYPKHRSMSPAQRAFRQFLLEHRPAPLG